MRKKLFLLLCVMTAAFMLLVPCAFADQTEAEASVVAPAQDATEYTASFDGSTNAGGNVTSSTTENSSITNVDVSIDVVDSTTNPDTPITDATKIVVSGMTDSEASTKGTIQDASFYAGGKVELKKDVVDDSDPNNKTTTVQDATITSDGKVSIDITVSGNYINKDEFGVALYDAADNSLKSYIDDSKITSNGTSSSTVAISMESLYNFMLMKYSKYATQTIVLQKNDVDSDNSKFTTKTDDVSKTGVEIILGGETGSAELKDIEEISATIVTPTTIFKNSGYDGMTLPSDVDCYAYFEIALNATGTNDTGKTIPTGQVAYKYSGTLAENDLKCLTLYEKDTAYTEALDKITVTNGTNSSSVVIIPNATSGKYLLAQYDIYDYVEATTTEKKNEVGNAGSNNFEYTYELTATVNNKNVKLVIDKDNVQLKDIKAKFISGYSSKYLTNKGYDINFNTLMNTDDELYYGFIGYNLISANDNNGTAANFTASDFKLQITSPNTIRSKADNSTDELKLYDFNLNSEAKLDLTNTITVETSDSVSTVEITPTSLFEKFFIGVKKFVGIGTSEFVDNVATVAVSNDSTLTSVKITKLASNVATKATVLVPTATYISSGNLYTTADKYLNVLKIQLTDADDKVLSQTGNIDVEIIIPGMVADDTHYIALYKMIEKTSTDAAKEELHSDDVVSVSTSGTSDVDYATTINIEFANAYTFAVEQFDIDRGSMNLTIEGKEVSNLKSEYSINDGKLKYIPALNLIRLTGYENKEAANISIAGTGNYIVDVAELSTITGGKSAISITGSPMFIGKAVLQVAVDKGVTAISPSISSSNTRDTSKIVINDNSDKYSRKVSLLINADNTYKNKADKSVLIFDSANNTKYMGYGFSSGLALTTGSGGLGARGSDADKYEINTQVLSETNQECNSYGDVGVYEFSMVASGSKLTFDYIFASKEFDQSYIFNDAFGLFVDVGDGKGYQNIAKFTSNKVLEETGDANKALKNITMSNIRYDMGAQNAKGQITNLSALNSDPTRLQYKNGYYYTCTYTAFVEIPVDTITNQKNVKVKYVITDVGDSSYESFVLIREGSFSMASTVTIDDGLGHTATVEVNDTDKKLIDSTYFSTITDQYAKVGYEYKGKWVDQDGNEFDTVSQVTDWTKISKLSAVWAPRTYYLSLQVDNKEIDRINYVYAIDWEGLKTMAKERYVPTKKGYNFVGWSGIPNSKPTTNSELKEVLVATAEFEAKKYKLILDDSKGRQSTVYVTYDQVIPDVAPAKSEGFNVFGGYYYNGVMLYDGHGKANGYVWNIDDYVESDVGRADKVKVTPYVIAYAKYVQMNTYRWDQYKTFDVNSDQPLQIKYKYTSYGPALNQDTKKEVKIYINGKALDETVYTLKLDQQGNLLVEIDCEYLKKLGIGKHEIMTTFFDRKFVTELTIRDFAAESESKMTV